MRIVMLDVDGVLNSEQSSTWYWRKNEKQCVYLNETMFCPNAVSNLQLLLDEHKDIKIVLSSSWRIHHDISYLENVLRVFWCMDTIKIIDKTPRFDGKPRGDEIFDWVLRHKDEIKDLLILDDDTDMGVFKGTPFYQNVDAHVGLDYYALKKAKEHFDLAMPDTAKTNYVMLQNIIEGKQ